MLRFRIEIFIGMLLMALLGASILGFFHLYRHTRLIHEASMQALTQKRDAKIEGIQFIYKNLLSSLKNRSGEIQALVKEDKTAQIEAFVKTSFPTEFNIQGIAYYNGNFEKVLDTSEISKSIHTETIKKTIFQEDIALTAFYLEKDVFYQNILLSLDKGNAFLVFRISVDLLRPLFQKQTLEIYTLLSGDYRVILSTGTPPTIEISLHPLTQKMLDGKVGTESYAGSLHAYAYADLGTSAIYVDASITEESVAGSLQKEGVYTLFIILFVGLLSLLMTTGILRIRRKKILRTVDTHELKLLQHFEETLSTTLKKLDGLSEALQQLEQIRNNLEDTCNYAHQLSSQKEMSDATSMEKLHEAKD